MRGDLPNVTDYWSMIAAPYGLGGTVNIDTKPYFCHRRTYMIRFIRTLEKSSWRYCLLISKIIKSDESLWTSSDVLQQTINTSTAQPWETPAIIGYICYQFRRTRGIRSPNPAFRVGTA